MESQVEVRNLAPEPPPPTEPIEQTEQTEPTEKVRPGDEVQLAMRSH